MSQRTDQLASVIRAAVQAVLSRGLGDPRVRGLISVTRVDVALDLAQAKVYVSVLPAEQAPLAMHGLRSAAGHIQSEIARDVVARRMPRLSFSLDDSLKKQAMIDQVIAQTQTASPAEALPADQDRSQAGDWKDSSP